MPASPPAIPAEHRADVERLWNYHHMHHAIRPVDVGIGLGSHDLGVAKIATDLYHRGMYPHLVFTGANAPTTIGTFPRGEAVHYREYAIAHGVPADAILIDTQAENTGQNIEHTRALLTEHQIQARSVILMSRPYQQRRAYATCKKLWPEVDVICASHPLSLDDYVTSIGDAKKVMDMLVGDTQRIDKYAEFGFAIPQHVPDDVRAAYSRLVDAGYTTRLV
ncbi:YdcF family protein [Micromonospora rifamycinica]|uniref:YdcF family protein n=1 Tax=Micromonospora rifamycinica TaxID=291594 RepID=UPI0033FAD506